MLNEAVRSNIEDIYPLSPMQQGMLFHNVYAPESDVYVVQWHCHLPATLDVADFEWAWQCVIKRHAILRTAFLWQDLDEPLQIVGRHAQCFMTHLDWSDLDPASVQSNLQQWLKADQMQGFVLTAAPLMRLTIIKLPDQSYQFLWSYHHLLLDGWSWPLVLQEVFAFYEAFQRQQDLQLPEARPYKDYITWLQQQDLEQAERFWRQTLRGFTTPTPFGVDHAPQHKTSEIAQTSSYEARLLEQESNALYAFARNQKITINTLVQGMWALLLSRYSNMQDVVFGAVVSGRPYDLERVESMVGVFINTLPVRVHIPEQRPCLEWLRELQLQQLEARQYEYSPLLQIQKWSEVPAGQSLFESLVVFENFPVDTLLRQQARQLEIKNAEYIGGTNYPLNLIVEAAGQFTWRLVYDSERFDALTIQRLSNHFQALLASCIAHPDQYVEHFSLLSQVERQQILIDWNDTYTPNNDCFLHKMVEKWAMQTPDAPALVFEQEEVTFGELNRRANWLAHCLQARGIGPDVLIGLCVERSIEMIVGLLGVMKAGGAYVPLDPTYPSERLAYILEDADISLLLTQTTLRDLLPQYKGQVFYLDIDWSTLDVADSIHFPLTDLHADNLAYIIYTSGSTGAPKGVMVPHRGLANLAQVQQQRFALLPGNRVLQFASLCFDASIWEIAMALASGSTLVLGSREALQPANLLQFLVEQQITCSTLPPPVLASLSPDTRLSNLHTLIVAGEACPLNVVQRWSQGRSMFNAYGPTEITIGCSLASCTAEESISPSIGGPISNVQMYILDAHMQPVPVGLPGEIYIGGVGVTRGYLRRPDLTAERFVPDPFSREAGAHLYKSGDLATFRADGSITYIGRNDHQIKIRGFRVELGEIEATLMRHPDVRDAVVLLREDEPGVKHLVGYIVADTTHQPTTSSLRQFLVTHLPDYLVPAAFVIMEAFPLTPSNKVDRNALSAPDWVNRPQLSQAYVAPRTHIEEQLVEVWSKILGRRQVGIHDNFFELGGDSIISLQIVAEAMRQGLQLTPRQLFQYPTIAELATVIHQIDQLLDQQVEQVQGVVPLTPIQHWFFDLHWSNVHYFNQAQLWCVPADLKLDALEKALLYLLHHHDALRIHYIQCPDGNWQQENLGVEETAFALEQRDLSGLTSSEQETALQQIALAAQNSLHLTDGPLLRAIYCAYGADQPGRLLVVVHHLVIDMVSWRILLEDLETAYTQLSQYQSVQLPPKSSSFKQWAEQLVTYAQEEQLLKELPYWQGTNLDVSLPVDLCAARNAVADTALVEVALEEEETLALCQNLPHIYHTQINDVLLLALAQTLADWIEHRSVLIDLEGHGREDIGGNLNLSRTVGWFTALYPVAFHLPAQGGLEGSLQYIKEQLRAIPHHGLGYQILRYLSPRAQELRDGPRPQVSFNYLGQFDTRLSGEMKQAQHFYPASETSGMPHSPTDERPHLLDVTGYIKDGKLWMTWEYNHQVHLRATIEKLAQNYLKVIRDLLQCAQRPTISGYTPSDFPTTQLNQQQIDRLIGKSQDIESIYALSPLQQGLLFHSLYTPHAGTYIVQRVQEFQGEFDSTAFQLSWNELVERHAILRTAFAWEGMSEPVQVVYQQGRVKLERHDWRTFPQKEQQFKLASLLKAERARDFDFAQPSLFRLFLIQVSDDRYYYIEAFHHILLDGWSVARLQQELLDLYLTHSQGKARTYTPARPYRDYIDWLQRQDSNQAEIFWRKMLQGVTGPTSLQIDHSYQENDEKEYTTYSEQCMHLSAEMTAQLQNFARQQHITFNTVLQGAWALLLHRYSGDENVVFGVTVSGRPITLPGSEHMVGLFINTLPLRVCIDDQSSVSVWLKDLQELQSDMQQYAYSPLVQIQGWSAIPRGLPLFNSLFVFENYLTEAVSLAESSNQKLQATQIGSSEQTNYPLTIVVEPGEALSLRVIYQQERFSLASIKRLLSHMQTLLRAMLAQVGEPLNALTLVPQWEQQQFVDMFNRTCTDYPATKTIQQLFEEQVQERPGQTALIYGQTTLSYQELNRRANQLAHYLRQQGIGPDVLVALCLERSVEMIVSLLAILKAGGAYVPLDLTYPDERLALMLADTHAPVLIAQQTQQMRLPDYRGTIICLDSDGEAIAACSQDNLEIAMTAKHLAYIVYTSGSTGIPKGVCIPHHAVVRLVRNTNYMQFDASVRMAQLSNVSFDAATFEIWGTLLNGGCLVGVERAVALSPQVLHQHLQEQQVNTLFLTTALFNQIASSMPGFFSSLHNVLFGGEAVDPRWVQTILQHGRPQHLLHVYGPTESTTYATWYPVQSVQGRDATIPIGRPIANTTYYVLDKNFQPVPSGVPGELYLGGDGLARGYHQRPEITSERFVPHPWSQQPGERLYRTGDLVRMREDGNIDFLGRIDGQIKLRGFRIELGEIEAALLQHPQIREALVLLREDTPGDKRLVAYLIASHPPVMSSPADLRRFLQKTLPEYMLPGAFAWLEHFPINANGKIDRAAFPAPTRDHQEESDTYVVARNETEQRLVAIWESVLNVHPIGVMDNFFTLGGHSLLAIRLVSQIQQQFDQQLPLSVLFQHGTIEKLAHLLSKEHAKPEISALVPIQPEGTRRPFFCVHPGSGNVLQYQELARHLGNDQPVYGFQDTIIYADDAILDISIEDMAERYLKEMRQVQAEGPYYLGGYSFGGIVAFEMAQRLQADGQEVALLAIFDGGTPEVIRMTLGKSDETALLTIVVLELIRTTSKLQFQDLYKQLQEQDQLTQMEFVRQLLQEAQLDLPDTGTRWLSRQVQVFRSRVHAMLRYQPATYRGTITLFRASESDTEIADPILADDMGWGALSTQPLQKCVIPGYHEALFSIPNVGILVKQLQQYL